MKPRIAIGPRRMRAATMSLAAPLALICSTAAAHADAQPGGWQTTATGDWGGLRQTLSDDGIDIRGGYLGQLGSDVSGGKSTGTDYAQQISFAIDWNLAKLAGWSGATLHTAVIDRVGNPLSKDHTGAALEQNYVYGSGENFRISDLSLEQTLAHGRVSLRGGYVLVGLEFAATPGFCNFGLINNAFCAHPQYLGVSSGYQLGPVPQFGGRVKVALGKAFYAEAGVFENNPQHLLPAHGFDLSLVGDAGAMLPFELGYTPSFGGGRLPGHYKVGGLFDTTNAKDPGDPLRVHQSRYVLWLLADQMVYRPDPQTNRGLTVFAQVGAADKRTSPEPFWLAAGAFYQGLVPHRPDDTINLAWAHAAANRRGIDRLIDLAAARNLPGTTYAVAENDFEASYSVHLRKWLTFTPDFQYVVNPGAPQFQHYRNASVLSLQATAVF